ncbi:MAG: hypothetical protein HOV79_01940 [Hamadaea sp.]|nr:hypothetical protein [Hamadaea sp.]
MLTVVMASFFGLFVMVAAKDIVRPDLGWKLTGVGFGLGAVFFLYGTFRAPFVGVTATEKGIAIRSPILSKRIPWDEVADIKLESMSGGASGAGGAQAPIVYRMRPDGSKKRIEIKPLGAYNIGEGKSLAERATRDLQACLKEWRRGARAESRA